MRIPATSSYHTSNSTQKQQRIKKKQYAVSSDARELVKMDTDFVEVYKGVAKFMKSYSAGKIAKPFKFIPAMQQWEDALYLTEPEKWSPNGMHEATRILASNLTSEKAERFYKHVLLPRVRQDIRNKKKKKPLHFSLYQYLKKSVHKRAAFFKGILLPLCESKTCTLKEASVVGSIIQKIRISSSHAGAAIMMLAEMEYSSTRSYFTKLLLEKQYALPNSVIEALVAHFVRALEEQRVMPVIWHQSLLAFAQLVCIIPLRYKNDITKDNKDKLRNLLEAQNHHEITPEVRRELFHSCNQGKMEHDGSSSAAFGNPIGEDMFDMPEVPMEDD